jgi:hypothetical protein
MPVNGEENSGRDMQSDKAERDWWIPDVLPEDGVGAMNSPSAQV